MNKEIIKNEQLCIINIWINTFYGGTIQLSNEFSILQIFLNKPKWTTWFSFTYFLRNLLKYFI